MGKRDAQVVLGLRPVPGQFIAGSHLQGTLVGVARLLQILGSLSPFALSRQIVKCDAQVVLDLRPVLGQFVPGVNQQGGVARLISTTVLLL